MRKLRSTLMHLMCFLLCFTMFMPALFAAQTKSSAQTVYDYAGLLTDSEIESLETQINEIKQTYKMDAYILTTNDTQGKSTTAFADDFFFDLGYGRDNKNSILMLIDMDNRQVWMSTSGTAVQYFTDARINIIYEKVKDKLSDGQYFAASELFLNKVALVVNAPLPTTNSEETSLPTAPLEMADYLLRGGIAAIIALIVSMITYFSICYSYTHPRFTQPVTAPDRSSVHYTDKKDMFIHTHTSRIRIKDDSDTGGGGSGSSTHSSSGGGSFGGGGGGF